MGEDRFETLTNEQRHCLRLVAQGYSSKEIARPLGLHPRSIDARLDRARHTLGNVDRAEAARAFVRYEAKQSAYDCVIYDPPAIVPSAEPSQSREATWGEAKPLSLNVVREAQASVPWDIAPRQDAPTTSGRHNAFSPIQRLALTVAIIVGSVLSIVAAPALLDSYQRVANSIDPPHLDPKHHR